MANPDTSNARQLKPQMAELSTTGRLKIRGTIMKLGREAFGTDSADNRVPAGEKVMLGLSLREEFRGKRLRGTAIELSDDTNTGATEIAAKEFLEITYPTHDLLMGIEAVGSRQRAAGCGGDGGGGVRAAEVC